MPELRAVSGVKGWIDRVFTSGFAYGPAVPPPYGESSLTGRRALVSVTVGARDSAFSDRGIHGSFEDVLHPMRHGLFWFTGMNPLEPFAVYSSNELPDDRFVRARTEYARRLDTLFLATPVPFRSLTGGDYDHDMRLLPRVETPGTRGLDSTCTSATGSEGHLAQLPLSLFERVQISAVRWCRHDEGAP